MQLKSIRTKLIISGIYVLLLGILLISMTLGKYQDTRIAYASYGAASFNTVILGENQLVEVTEAKLDDDGEEIVDDDGTVQMVGTGTYQWNDDGVVNEFGVSINTADYMPGMIWNEDSTQSTAEEFSFVVANGRSLEYVSEASVEYYVRLRTLNSLPLEYTLSYTYTNADTGLTEIVRYVTGEPEKIVLDDTGDIWYEYSFYVPDDTIEVATDGATDETTETTVDTSLLEEAIFSIYGGSLGMNEHSLVLEWPSDGDANDVRYMKEIETLQILVTSSSKNLLEEDGYIGDVDEDISYQSSGIIILDPTTGEELTSTTVDADTGESTVVGTRYTYEIDYRSFVTDGTQKSFLLSVDNGVRPDESGVNTGVEHDSNSSSYTVWLKVPYVATGYGYGFYESISDATSTSFVVYEYRVYDTKTGTYKSYTNDPVANLDDTDDLYVIYRLMADGSTVQTIKMTYATSLAGNTTNVYDVNDHKLVITSPPDDDVLAAMAFDNKLELWLENTYS